MSRHYPSVLVTFLLLWRDHNRGHASKREFLIEGLFTVSEGSPIKVMVGSMAAGRKARHYRQRGGLVWAVSNIPPPLRPRLLTLPKQFCEHLTL